METVAKQREELEKEKVEAQTKLDQLDNEVSVSECVHAIKGIGDIPGSG